MSADQACAKKGTDAQCAASAANCTDAICNGTPTADANCVATADKGGCKCADTYTDSAAGC